MKKETNMQDNIRIEKERKYWDKYAPKYDRGIEKYWGFYAAVVDKISQDVEVGNTVLEVAAGTGAISLKVAEQAARVYAVDISPLMVDEAKKKMKEKGIGNVEFSVHDAYSLPFGVKARRTADSSNYMSG
jgi:ubiquinone/menaquinone biosynthesis C-methylase UbiE